MDDNDEVPSVLPLFSTGCPGSRYFIKSLGADVVVRTRPNAVASDDRPLFVDDVWPGALYLADHLQTNPAVVAGKSVLELGAGAALPSLVACKLGARRVVVTDYPAVGVVENITRLLEENGVSSSVASARGFEWGQDVTPLLLLSEGGGFDVLLLAELLWKDTVSLHGALLQSVRECLNAERGVALVSFAHRPGQTVNNAGATAMEHSPADDLAFFSLAASAYGLCAELVNSSSSSSSSTTAAGAGGGADGRGEGGGYRRDASSGGGEMVAVHLYTLRVAAAACQ